MLDNIQGMKADELFEWIRRNGAQAISRLFNEKIPEGLYLDYKCIGLSKSTQTDTLQPDDKKNLAKSISGFANTKGGVIVWGVHCTRSSTDKYDIPRQFQSKLDGALFRQQIDNYIVNCVTPRFPYVETIDIEIDHNTSVLVTFVPHSYTPVGSLNNTSTKFYVRHSSGFQQVAIKDIESTKKAEFIQSMILDSPEKQEASIDVTINWCANQSFLDPLPLIKGEGTSQRRLQNYIVIKNTGNTPVLNPYIQLHLGSKDPRNTITSFQYCANHEKGNTGLLDYVPYQFDQAKWLVYPRDTVFHDVSIQYVGERFCLFPGQSIVFPFSLKVMMRLYRDDSTIFTVKSGFGENAAITTRVFEIKNTSANSIADLIDSYPIAEQKGILDKNMLDKRRDINSSIQQILIKSEAKS